MSKRKSYSSQASVMLVLLVLGGCGLRGGDKIEDGYFVADNTSGVQIPLVAVKTSGSRTSVYGAVQASCSNSGSIQTMGLATSVDGYGGGELQGPHASGAYGSNDPNCALDSELTQRDTNTIHVRIFTAQDRNRTLAEYDMRRSDVTTFQRWMAQLQSTSNYSNANQGNPNQSGMEQMCMDLFNQNCASALSGQSNGQYNNFSNPYNNFSQTYQPFYR